MPGRIVLDAEGSIPSDAALFEDCDAAPVHVFVAAEVSEAAMERLEAAGAHVHPVPAAERGLDLDAVGLERLDSRAGDRVDDGTCDVWCPGAGDETRRHGREQDEEPSSQEHGEASSRLARASRPDTVVSPGRTVLWPDHSNNLAA